MIDRRFIDTFIESNKQFPKPVTDSDLWKSIKLGTEDAGIPCTDKQAQGYAEWHCNSEGFYVLCKARGFIEFAYSVWVEKLLKAELTSVKGFLKDKLLIAKLFAFEDEFPQLKYFEDYDPCIHLLGMDPDKGYEVKVYSNTGSGDHFMPCYIEDKILWVSDPSSRGIHKKFSDVVPKNKFQFLLEV